MATRARPTVAEIGEAKRLAESNGLRLTGYEKRTDGTVKLEFGEPEDHDDWRADCVLYGQAR